MAFHSLYGKKLGLDEFGNLRVQEGAISLGSGTKTATSTGATTTGSVTLNAVSGKITTPTLTTAALAVHTLTITNSKIAAADQVYVQVAQGTNTAGTPLLRSVVPGAGSVVILLENIHATNAYNGTFVISFMVVKA